MIRSMNDLGKYTFTAKDGDVGRVHDFYFDDTTWIVRYVILDTGRWLPGRRVLLSPEAIGRVEWKDRVMHLDLPKQVIEDSPAAAEDEPVSRQHERDLHEHYGWHPYWLAAPSAMGAAAAIPLVKSQPESDRTTATEQGDPHLRSVEEVSGYDIEAADGSLGVVSDFACEDGSWVIRYLVVDTRKWLPGKKVLVSPGWVEHIDWHEGKVHVGMTRNELKESPDFDPGSPINRRYEERLYDFYGRPRYWTEEQEESA